MVEAVSDDRNSQINKSVEILIPLLASLLPKLFLSSTLFLPLIAKELNNAESQ
jgi:hypothetical protein